MARTLVSPSAVMAYGLKDAANRWDLVNESQEWQNRIFHVLAALYDIVVGVALARVLSTNGLRPSFLTINGVVNAIQIVLWLVIWWNPIPVLVILSKMFFVGVSLFAALGFLHYGGRFWQ